MAKKLKRVKVGFSLHEEAYKALREMSEGPRSYGDFISALILAERNKRRERSLLATLARIDERLKELDVLNQRLDEIYGPVSDFLASQEHRG